MVKCISQFSASVRANIEISTLEGMDFIYAEETVND